MVLFSSRCRLHEGLATLKYAGPRLRTLHSRYTRRKQESGRVSTTLPPTPSRASRRRRRGSARLRRESACRSRCIRVMSGIMRGLCERFVIGLPGRLAVDQRSRARGRKVFTNHRQRRGRCSRGLGNWVRRGEKGSHVRRWIEWCCLVYRRIQRRCRRNSWPATPVCKVRE